MDGQPIPHASLFLFSTNKGNLINVHNDQLIHGFLVYIYCNMCYGADCFRETYVYMWNQTHVQDNMTDKEALLTFKYKSHESYLYLQPQILCLMCILNCYHNICYSAMCYPLSYFPYINCLVPWCWTSGGIPQESPCGTKENISISSGEGARSSSTTSCSE